MVGVPLVANVASRKTIAVINSAERSVRNFVEPLAEIVVECGQIADVIEYADATADRVADCDAVIVSGSPRGDDIVATHAKQFAWLKDDVRPLLGVCAGHHVLGYLFGSDLIRDREAEQGHIDVEVLTPDPLVEGHQSFVAYSNHCDAISVPPGFRHIANSTTCHNQIMCREDRPHYGVQFHPEQPESCDFIVRNFVSRIVSPSSRAC